MGVMNIIVHAREKDVSICWEGGAGEIENVMAAARRMADAEGLSTDELARIALTYLVRHGKLMDPPAEGIQVCFILFFVLSTCERTRAELAEDTSEITADVMVKGTNATIRISGGDAINGDYEVETFH